MTYIMTELYADSKYLIFPANHNSQDKRLSFYKDGKIVYDIVFPLDYETPEYYFPLNIERFNGERLGIECDKDIKIRMEKANTADTGYDGRYRPCAHFTAKRGWLNDPNGLVYYNGLYHMFYQHNPVDCKWENMHWGHAVSSDLIHWQEKDIVLFPDENGTMFSGSAIVDRKNVTGLKQNDNDVILLFYTCAGSTSKASVGKPFTQNLAYSTDGGITFVKYENNPLIEQTVGGNRDPKVIYYEPDDCYIMALFLEEHEYVLYRSNDMLHWTEIQHITIEDDAECPDFFPLTEDEGNVKWVFIGASDRYLLGSFDGKSFTPDGETHRLNYGDNSYAAQSWSDTPDGRRIRTAFSTVIIPGEPYASCMNVPQEMELRKVGGQLKLCVSPVQEIESLYTSQRIFESVCIDPNKSFKHPVASKCCDIVIQSPADKAFSFELFGFTLSYDPEKAVVICLDKEAPAHGENNIITIRILIDTVAAEVFTDDGSVFMGMTYIQDYNLNRLCISSQTSVTGIRLTVNELDKFWDEQI